MSTYLTRKPTLRLCSGSPRIGAFEKQLSLIKTPELRLNDKLPPLTYDLSDEPSSADTISISDDTIGSGAVQLERKLNPLRKSNRLISFKTREQLRAESQAKQKLRSQSLESSANNKSKWSPMVSRSNSLSFKVPVKELTQLKFEVEALVTNFIHFLSHITRNDVEMFFDGLSEVFIGIFAVFGAEILDISKDAFLLLVQLVTVSVIRIGFRNATYDSLLFQSPIVSIFERSNLATTVKRSVTRLIAIFQTHLLLSTLRVTAAFKSKHYIESSKMDSLSIMCLGLIMVLICLNLIFNALPASRRYTL